MYKNPKEQVEARPAHPMLAEHIDTELNHRMNLLLERVHKQDLQQQIEDDDKANKTPDEQQIMKKRKCDDLSPGKLSSVELVKRFKDFVGMTSKRVLLSAFRDALDYDPNLEDDLTPMQDIGL